MPASTRRGSRVAAIRLTVAAALLLALGAGSAAASGSGKDDTLASLKAADIRSKLAPLKAAKDAAYKEASDALAALLPPKHDLDFWTSNRTNPCVASPKWRPDPSVKPAFDLRGRVAVVTGASPGGIGAAVADALVAEGVTVLGTSRTPSTHHPPPRGVDLLELDVADPDSVAAFAAAVAAHPAVVGRGGLDILVHAAGRTVVGTPGPPPSVPDYSAWMAGVWLGLQTNYFGAVRVTNALWPLLDARAAAADKGGGGGVKGKARYARVAFTVSPLGWSSGKASPFLWAYTASQRALVAYANNLRAAVSTTAGGRVKISVLAPMATATRLVTDARRPVWLQPPGSDRALDAFVDDLRAGTADGLDPAWVAAAYVQALREGEPIANAAVGAPAGTAPPDAGGTTDKVAPDKDSFVDVLTADMLGSAFVAVPPKAAAAIISGVPEQQQEAAAAAAAAAAHGRRRRRLASSLKDDADRWLGAGRVPCTPLPKFYPTPGFDADAAAASLKGAVVVVTGATGTGVGRALADLLAASGAAVIGTSRHPAGADAGRGYDVLQLDQANQTSVDEFAAAVAAHPAVVRAGGLDFAVLNAGRMAVGAPGPPPLQDEAMFYSAIEAAQQTNFLGPIRVTHGLWPLLAARAGNASAPPTRRPRLIFTASASSWAMGGADPITPYYWSYAASKRASLAYYDALWAVLTAGGTAEPPVVTATHYPMAVNTRLFEGRRPAFLSPVDGAGWPVGDPLFSLMLWTIRDGLTRALDPAFVAAADVELMTAAAPPPDVVTGSWAMKPPTRGRLGEQQDIWDLIAQMEDWQSAFPWEARKADAGGEGQAA